MNNTLNSKEKGAQTLLSLIEIELKYKKLLLGWCLPWESLGERWGTVTSHHSAIQARRRLVMTLISFLIKEVQSKAQQQYLC